MKKRYYIILLGCLLIMGYAMAGFCMVPRITVPGGERLTEEQAEAILSVEQGIYSRRLPLIAAGIQLLEVREGYIFYKVSYFPFGSIERSYSQGADGDWFFNLERPLTRLKIVRGIP